MTVRVYRDDEANSVVIETGSDGSIGMRFNNELRAIGNGDGTCSILNPPKSTDTEDYAEVSSLLFSEFVDENNNALGVDEASTTNALNTILRHTGDPAGTPPVITSATAITVSDGDVVNYTLEADAGVGYEWSNIPAGLSVQNGNLRKLIGTITGGAGVYTPTMTATNYYGQDTETLTITVTSSFANTKSINFNNQDYLGANAALLDPILGRAGNGSGASDAWSIAMYFKGGTSNNASQTIFYFGDNDVTNQGHIYMRYIGSSDSLRFQYGSANNHVRWTGPANLLPQGTWKHIMVVYDGGTTGSASGSVSNYYNRFRIFVDGVDVTNSGTWSNSNFGYSGGIDADNLRVGRYASGNYMRNNCRVDELAIWEGDERANIDDIYNSGVPFDLSGLSSPPDHWWRMGDGDSYPTIQDNVGTAHFVMYNMTAADIVNDVP
ncbi:MAG: hypothetical protein MJH10_11060 [Epibacterium sp.]|nr:hypothetical protein [Epibacterium sp.]NQX74084.1 hypothetical protein [Epibacterium sp.]